MASKRRAKNPKPEQAVEHMPVELTAPELAERADEIAKLIGDRSGIESEKASTAASFRERLEVIDDRVDALARELREKRIDREVRVEHVMNFKDKVVETFRLDTQEMVRTRPMTFEELQLRFFGTGGGHEAEGEASPHEEEPKPDGEQPDAGQPA